MRTFSEKPKSTQPTKSVMPSYVSRANVGQGHDPNSIHNLQRTIGNQAVQRLLQSNPEEHNAVLSGTNSPHFGYDFSWIPVRPPSVAGIQTKLAINKPGDEYEQEADRVTEQVMRLPEQRPIADHEPLRTKRVHDGDTGQISAPPIVHEALAAPGQTLDSATRGFMESRFSHDFSQVRVHSGSRANDAARALQARAFTMGHNIVFGDHQFAPESVEGRRLLAHELTHVVQQSNTDASHPGPRINGLLQRDGPASSVESFEVFSATQRNFLQDNGIDPAGLDPTVARRMESLLSTTQRAHQALQRGDFSAVTTDPQVAVTINRTIGDAGAEISVMVVAGDSSMIISRRLDMATGTLMHQFTYQDVDGNRIEVEAMNASPPQILERLSLELGPARPPEIAGPLLEGFPLPESPELSPAESLDDFSDLLPSGTPEAGSSEGVGAFLEGAIIGDFGENESWSAIGGQTVVGFIPIAGQVADVRDLLASFRGVAEGREGAWLNVAIAGVAFVPGLDFLKGGARVGRRALREAAEESITEVSEAALRRARRVLSRGAVETARRRLRALAAGRIELMQRLTELSDNPAISRRTRDLIQNARNSIRDHMTPQDLSGALRDRLGIPVRRSGSGEAFDHLGEVQTALDSLTGARRALLGDLQRLQRQDPHGEAFRIVSRELDAMTEMRRGVLEFLETR